jgi:hypothetical protein
VADFTVRVTSGVIVSDWLDPATSARPSRLNARAGRPMKRYVATVGVPVVLQAVVGGVVGPADAALGGRLFVAAVTEAPNAPAAKLESPLGYSSRVTFTADRVGHHTVRIRRPDGGNEHIQLDVGNG